MTDFRDARLTTWAAAYVRIDQAADLREHLRQMRMNEFLQPQSPDVETLQARQHDRDDHERQIAGLLTEADLLIKLLAVPDVLALQAGEWLEGYYRDKAERQQDEYSVLAADLGIFEQGRAKDDAAP